MRARAHGDGEVLDLRSGVVVVELARHVAALPFEQVGDRVAERGLAAVADMQRSGRIRRHEFDDHAFAGAGIAAPVVALRREHRGDDLLARGRSAGAG